MAGDRAQCEVSQMSARLVNGKMRGTQPEVLLGFCFDHRRLDDWQGSMVEKMAAGVAISFGCKIPGESGDRRVRFTLRELLWLGCDDACF